MNVYGPNSFDDKANKDHVIPNPIIESTTSSNSHELINPHILEPSKNVDMEEKNQQDAHLDQTTYLPRSYPIDACLDFPTKLL